MIDAKGRVESSLEELIPLEMTDRVKGILRRRREFIVKEMCVGC
jgi:hypothetical protein